MLVAFAADRLFGFALIMIVTRWWSPASVGQWTQVIALTGAFAVTTSLGLFQAHVRFAEESADPRVRYSLQLSIVTATTLAMGVLTLASMAMRRTVSHWAFGSDADVSLVLAACLLATSDLWIEFVTTQFRAQLQTGFTAGALVGKAILRFLVVAPFALRSHVEVATIVGVLAALQAAAALLAILVFFHGSRWLSTGFAPAAKLFRRALVMAAPTLLAAVAAQLFMTAERWFLARTFPAVIAHYNIGQQIASNAMLAYIILGSMLYPMMVRTWRAGDTAATASLQRDAITVYALVTLPALAILPAISRAVVAVITTRYYEIDGVTMFLFMLGAFGFGIHQLAGYALYVTERTRDLLLLLGGAAVGKVLLAGLLIPRWAEHAAALSWGISGTLLAVATVIRGRQLLTFSPPWRVYARGTAAALAGGVAVALVCSRLQPGNRLGELGVGAAGVAAYFLFVWPDLRNALAFREASPA